MSVQTSNSANDPPLGPGRGKMGQSSIASYNRIDEGNKAYTGYKPARYAMLIDVAKPTYPWFLLTSVRHRIIRHECVYQVDNGTYHLNDDRRFVPGRVIVTQEHLSNGYEA